MLVCEGSISAFSLYGQLADYYWHIFSLIHLADEFSFIEMRAWDQNETSSCCVCDWCWSRKIGCRGSPRFPTLMVESFFAYISYKKLLDRVIFGIMFIALARSWSTMAAFQQPTFIDSFLAIRHKRLPCLPSKWISPGCPKPFSIGLNSGSSRFF